MKEHQKSGSSRKPVARIHEQLDSASGRDPKQEAESQPEVEFNPNPDPAEGTKAATSSTKTADVTICRDMAPAKALFTMAVPTIISQIILVIYNLADTWYVGMSGNPAAVAAVSLCLPTFTCLTGIANLFGIGGASVMSRYMGEGNQEKARKVFTASVYGAALIGLLYSILIALGGSSLLYWIGADSSDIHLAWNFSLFAIILGGIPTILPMTLAQLIRAAGKPNAASIGMILGAVCNIILDPLFMFVLLPKGNEVSGAAIATALSNCISLLYYIVFLHQSRSRMFVWKENVLSRSFMDMEQKIVANGLPSFCLIIFSMFSNCILNQMISSMGAEAVAGMGIVRKVDQLAYAVNQGMTQGMLPIAAYCFGAGLYSRMNKVTAYAAAGTEIVSLICTTISLIFAPQLIGFFIQDAATISYGSRFLRIVCLCIPLYSILFVIIAYFQAAGKNTPAFVLSLLHKGIVDVIFFFIIRSFFGTADILWGSVMAEIIALCVGIILYIRMIHHERHDLHHLSFHHAAA